MTTTATRTDHEATRNDLDRDLEAANHRVQMLLLQYPNLFARALVLADYQGFVAHCADDQEILESTLFWLGEGY